MNLFQKACKNQELKERLLLTFLLIVAFRCMSFIPVPFVNRYMLKKVSETGIVAYASMFSGGALSNFTIMATGISAYISASIVVQLLTYTFKKFSDISKSPGGDKVVKRITIILGVIAAFLISLGTTMAMQKFYNILTNDAWYVYLLIAIIHSAGTGMAVWIGETITNKGFGNGVSLLIFINIISSLPRILSQTNNKLKTGEITLAILVLCIVIASVVIMAIIVSETSVRKIPIQYSKVRARGKTRFGGSSGYFPIKLNLTGVMPIIFASTFMQIIMMIGQYTTGSVGTWVKNYLSYGTPLYSVIMAILIFFFSYFYSALIFNPKEISNNIQNNGGTIPGIRPGLPTGEYIENINKSLTFIGALYLSIISLIPSLIFAKLSFNGLATTSLMIMVGVALETSNKIRIEAETGVLPEL